MLCAFVLSALPALLTAQRDTLVLARGRQDLPRDVRREIVDRWNQTAAFRATGRGDIAEGKEVRGDVAVLRGPLYVSGHVTGSVIAVNSDVILRPSARIDGDLFVVGGEVDGRSDAFVGGEIRIYRQTLRYREEGERIVAETEQPTYEPEDEGWWRRAERRTNGSWSEALRIAQAGPYNRVEGLPVAIGPSDHERHPWGTFRLDAAAIVRTSSSFNGDDSDVGHDVSSELRVGRAAGVGVGGRLFNVVDPVETWQLSGNEAALAAFLFHRDYRDYYQRHGGRGFVTLYTGGSRAPSLTLGLSDERWGSRTLHDPFTLFNDDAEWRSNPAMDEGRFHIANATLRVDTRSDPDVPWSGWYVTADLENGQGRYTGVGLTTTGRASAAGDAVNYTRGFLDVRRYNRLSPAHHINLRLVLGGWLNGDQLPLERRLSVEGPGAMPGFRFRAPHSGADVGLCSTGFGAPGLPAQCDRIALAQVEYRDEMHVDWDWEEGPRTHHHTTHAGWSWVVFADAGRGWLVGTPGNELTYGRSEIPPLSSFRTDVGAGLDFGSLGIYGAKSVSTPAEPLNFFVRLRHRF
jgi:hypothetical protein